MHASVNCCHAKTSVGDVRKRPTKLYSGISIEGLNNTRTTCFVPPNDATYVDHHSSDADGGVDVDMSLRAAGVDH